MSQRGPAPVAELAAWIAAGRPQLDAVDMVIDPADVDALRVVEVAGTAHELRRSGNIVDALDSATVGVGAVSRYSPFRRRRR
jgi:hypothetical protein